MGDIKGQSTPKKSTSKQENENSKSPAKPKSSTTNSSTEKTKITPIKESQAKKTPTKSSTIDSKILGKTQKKTPVKDVNKNTPIKQTSNEKNITNKDSSDFKKTPVKEPSPVIKKSLDSKGTIRKREGLPISRVRTIMKTARYAEAISPDAVQLTAIATELFVKYLMKSVCDMSSAEKKKRIDYNVLAKYVNNDREEHLEFLRVLIPHKITVAKYKKLMAESPKNSNRLDFLPIESEVSESGSEEESEDESGEEEEESEDSDSDIQEIPAPRKSLKTHQQLVKKTMGKAQTVNLCDDSSSEDDFIILGQKKNQGQSGKGFKVL